MYLIVGLGNPEEEYANTRHNMGFQVINELSKEYGIQVNKNKFNGLYGKGDINGKTVLLLKPQTYMNLSGEAVKRYVDYYKIEQENIIIIFDDIASCVGIRIPAEIDRVLRTSGLDKIRNGSICLCRNADSEH